MLPLIKIFPFEPDIKLEELPNTNVDELIINALPSNVILSPDPLPTKKVPSPSI